MAINLYVDRLITTPKLRNGKENVGVYYSGSVSSVGTTGGGTAFTITGDNNHIIKIFNNLSGYTSAVSGLSYETENGDLYVAGTIYAMGDVIAFNSGGTSGSTSGTTYGSSGTSGTSGVDGTGGGTSGTSGTSGVDGNGISLSGTTNYLVKFSGDTATETLAYEEEDGDFYIKGTLFVDGDVIAFNSGGTSGSTFSGTSGTSGVDGTNGSSGTSGVDGAGVTVTGTTNHFLKFDTENTSSLMYEESDGDVYIKGNLFVDFDVIAFNSGGTSGSTFSGTSGSSGTSGVDGTTGLSGTNGTSGSSGTSGYITFSGTTNHILKIGNDGTSALQTSAYEEDDGDFYITGTLFVNGDVIAFNSGGTSGSAFSGSSGTSGTSGINGTMGLSGSSGVNGTSGSSGSSGINGTSGSSGSSGINGTSGSSGTRGTSGTNGTSGSSGINGTSGSSGTRGTSGTNGTSGSSGTSGVALINNNTLGYVLGATGTSGIISGNSGLTFDGTNLHVKGSVYADGDIVAYTSGSTTNYSGLVNYINEQTGTTYTLQLIDIGGLVRCSNTSAITLYIPKNSVVAIPIKTVITVEQKNIGQVTIAPVDGDVTVYAYNGLKTLGRYAAVSLVQVSANVWVVYGGKS